MAQVIYPVPPIFINEKLDLAATAEYIKYLLDDTYGTATLMTTAGTSQFNLLEDSELLKFNKTVASFNCEVILGLPPSHLKRTVKLARKLPKERDVLLLFPDRYYSDNDIIQYFTYVATSVVQKIYVHGSPLRHSRGGSWDYSVNVLEFIREYGNNESKFKGIKEEFSSLEVAHNILPVVREDNKDFKIFVAGGSQRRFLALQLYEVSGFLAGVGSLFPQIDEMFCDKIKSNDIKGALDINKTEIELFNVFMKIGWHKAMREAISQLLFDGANINRRPFPRCLPQESVEIKNVIANIDSGTVLN